jgi:hypothetical protein
MRAITTLLDRENTLEHAVLSEESAILYGGDLGFPAPDDRPYVIGNFVITLEGVTSFEPGKSGGGEISGFNEADRFIMGLLRASADAAIVWIADPSGGSCGTSMVGGTCVSRGARLLRSIPPAAAQQTGAADERDCERQRRRGPSKGGVPHAGGKCSYRRR